MEAVYVRKQERKKKKKKRKQRKGFGKENECFGKTRTWLVGVGRFWQRDRD